MKKLQLSDERCNTIIIRQRRVGEIKTLNIQYLENR